MTSEPMRFAVMPLRFSSEPSLMIRFLMDVGLAPSRTTVGDGFGELRAEAGWVMVRKAQSDATPGETLLCLKVDRADEVLTLAETAGLDAAVWDESYGRQAAVRGPHGERMWINEEQGDVYGYEEHSLTEIDTRLTVSAIRSSPDFEADRKFFAVFGFSPTPGGSEWWEALRGPGLAGLIGLHKPSEGSSVAKLSEVDPLHRVPLVELGFQTSEPLDELRDRLLTAGYDARIVADPNATKVHVIDPDGAEIEIHPRS